MKEVEKPASFVKMDNEELGLALFRQNPNKDWAPLPTPLNTFASKAFDGERKGSGEGMEWGSRRRERSSSWRPRSQSRTRGRDEYRGSGGDWDNWDGNWEDPS